MKQSVIKYQRLINEEIKIVGFEYVATLNRIEKLFGVSVGKVYSDTIPSYNKIDSNSITIKMRADAEPLVLKVNDVLTKDLFQEVISKMKIAGRALMDIKEQVDDTVREVRI